MGQLTLSSGVSIWFQGVGKGKLWAPVQTSPHPHPWRLRNLRPLGTGTEPEPSTASVDTILEERISYRKPRAQLY